VYTGTSTAPVRVSRKQKLKPTTLMLKRGGRLRDDGYRFNTTQVSSEFAAFAAYNAMGVPVPSAALYDCVISDGEEGKCLAMLLLTEFISGDSVSPDSVEQMRAITERECAFGLEALLPR
jgi:hypothetical protein